MAKKTIKRLTGYVSIAIIQTVFGLISIYFGLKVLDAEDYGTYAIISLIVAAIGSLVTGPVGIISAGIYREMDKYYQENINTTFLLLSFILGFLITVALIITWYFTSVLTEKFISPKFSLLAILTILPCAIANIYISIYYNIGLSTRLFYCVTAQVILALIVLLISLYKFNLEEGSLYLAQLSGYVAFSITSLLLNGRIINKINTEWVKNWISNYKNYGINILATNIPQGTEYTMLAYISGINSVAIWQHSKLYNTLLMKCIKVIGLSVWPISLKEAKDNMFIKTKIVWGIMYSFMGLIGVFFVFYSDLIVSLFSSGKLTPASIFISWWVIYIIIQYTGKEAEAVLYSTDNGKFSASAQTKSKCVGLFLTIIFVYLFGIAGAMMACITEILAYRYWLRRHAKLIQNIPAIDVSAFTNVMIIIMAIIYSDLLMKDNFESRIIGVAVGSLLILIINRSCFLNGIKLLKFNINYKV